MRAATMLSSLLLALLAAPSTSRAQLPSPADFDFDTAPRLRRAEARALVRSLPEVAAHARAIAPSRLTVVALRDATTTTTCTGSYTECLWWFRVDDAPPGARGSTWRFYGVHPYTLDVVRSSARRAMEVTSAPFVRVRGGAPTASPAAS